MTNKQKREERARGLYPHARIQKEQEFITDCTMSPEFSQVTSDIQENREQIQADQDTYSGSIIAQLVSQEDLPQARMQNVENKKRGALDKERLIKDKRKMTAARLMLEHNSYHLGQTLVDQLRHAQKMKLDEYIVKNEENNDILKKIMSDAKSCIEKHGGTADNIDKWSVKDITLLLRTYRTKKDSAIPTKKKEVLDLYNVWKHRKPTTYNGRVEIDLTMLLNEEEDMTGTSTTEEQVVPVPPLPALEEVKVHVPSTAVVEHILGRSELKRMI